MPVGMTSTSSLQTEDLLIREVRDEIALVDPNEAPLVTLLTKINNGKPTGATKFEFFEDDYLPRTVTTTAFGASLATGITAIPVVDASVVVPGDMLILPAAGSSANPPERMRITAVNYSTNTLTVTRAIGGIGAMVVPQNTALRIMAGAYEEGSGIPSSVRTSPVKVHNFTQIYKKSVDITRTADTVMVYGGSTMTRNEYKAMRELKRQINSSLMFGVPSENLTGPENGLPLRTTGGLLSRIGTNKLDMGGSLTWNNFQSAANAIFRYGPDRKMLLCPGIVMEAIHAWAQKKLLMASAETQFGMRITSVQTAYGTLMCVLDRSLENTGGVGFGNMALAIDPAQISKRVLSGNGKSAELSYYQDAVKDGRDRKINYYMGEWGWEIRQEKYHAQMYNITGFTELT